MSFRDNLNYPQPDFRPLTPWNPIDQFRLLWWLCIQPAQYTSYRAHVGEAEMRKVSAWLVSTLIWLPLFIRALGISLELTRTIERPPQNIPYSVPFSVWLVIIAFAWLLTGLFGISGIFKKGCVRLIGGCSGVFSGAFRGEIPGRWRGRNHGGSRGGRRSAL